MLTAILVGHLGTQAESTVNGAVTVNHLKSQDLRIKALGATKLSPLTPGQPVTLVGSVQIDGNVRFISKELKQPSDMRFRETRLDGSIAELRQNERHRQADLKQRIVDQRADVDELRGATAFIETLSVVSHGSNSNQVHQQWRLIAQDDFHTHTNGWMWSDGTPVEANRSHCSNFDHFLEAKGQQDLPVLAVSKTFDVSVQHTQLEIGARVHLIDSWYGSTMYAQVDGEYVWLDVHESDADAPDAELPAAGVSLCGGPAPHDRMSIPVKVIVPHTGSNVTISFGASALTPFGSFGIDDVAILAN